MARWNEPNNPVFATQTALDWALEHVEYFGDTVFVPTAFEYAAIRSDWDNIRTWLTQQDLRKWTSRPQRRFLASKGKYSFRYVTQLDPLEYLLFTALIYRVGDELEAIRVPKTKKKAYSWRFLPGTAGQIFDPDYRWHDFNQRCRILAERRSCRWVVVADIADFFAHIYLHPLENALDRATRRSPEAYCLLRMISNWNAFVSYGLPVGLAGSRILAEAAIADIDETIQGLGLQHCRYSDDMRIFCTSEAQARRALEHIAMHLFETHGLTLQSSKTEILPKQDYLDRFSESGERTEIESLTSRLQDLLDEAGWENEYEKEINYDELPADTQIEIDRLNLLHVLSEQLEMEHIDAVIVGFVLYRLKQLGIDEAVGLVLDNLDKLFPVIDSVVKYLESLLDLDQRSRYRIGRIVLTAARRVTTSTYERMCLLSLFTKGPEFDNENAFERLYQDSSEPAVRRELVLALGRADKGYWFQAQRRLIDQFDPWTRRAFIAAYSCVPQEQRGPFYRSLRQTQDVLEKCVMNWAAAHPF